ISFPPLMQEAHPPTQAGDIRREVAMPMRVATSPLLVLDSARLNIVEVNAAAGELLGSAPDSLRGRPLTDWAADGSSRLWLLGLGTRCSGLTPEVADPTGDLQIKSLEQTVTSCHAVATPWRSLEGIPLLYVSLQPAAAATALEAWAGD